MLGQGILSGRPSPKARPLDDVLRYNRVQVRTLEANACWRMGSWESYRSHKRVILWGCDVRVVDDSSGEPLPYSLPRIPFKETAARKVESSTFQLGLRGDRADI